MSKYVGVVLRQRFIYLEAGELVVPLTPSEAEQLLAELELVLKERADENA